MQNPAEAISYSLVFMTQDNLRYIKKKSSTGHSSDAE